MSLTLLNLEQPVRRADYESNAPTGVLPSDIGAMEQFLIGIKTHTGQIVTPEKAKRCSAVLACMRGISEDLSSLPLKLYKRAANGDEEATDHPVHRILNVAPNAVMTPLEVREHILLDMMLWGNFYNLKYEDPQNPGVLGSVWPLEAGYVTRLNRTLTWTYTDPTTGISGEFLPDDVWRGTIMSTNGLDGVALTLLAREAIGLLLAAEEQAARLFSYGVQSDLTLSTAEALNDDEKMQLRTAFMQRHAGSGNAWMPLILEGGLEAKRIGLTAQESQYIEARNFQIGDVARVFRYPDVLLGATTSGKSSTYASAEQFFQSYTKHTLIPWATRIEQAANRDLLTQKEQAKYYVKHDFDQLLAADQAARFDAWNKAISGGWMQPAEARKKERLPYKPGLEYFNRAKNMDSLGGSNEPAPTDNSAQDGLPSRVAQLVIKKERQAIVGQKQDADAFYTRFGGFVEEITGAESSRVTTYLESRRSNTDRFSTEAQDAAVAALINLCTKDTK